MTTSVSQPTMTTTTEPTQQTVVWKFYAELAGYSVEGSPEITEQDQQVAAVKAALEISDEHNVAVRIYAETRDGNVVTPHFYGVARRGLFRVNGASVSFGLDDMGSVVLPSLVKGSVN